MSIAFCEVRWFYISRLHLHFRFTFSRKVEMEVESRGTCLNEIRNRFKYFLQRDGLCNWALLSWKTNVLSFFDHSKSIIHHHPYIWSKYPQVNETKSQKSRTLAPTRKRLNKQLASVRVFFAEFWFVFSARLNYLRNN